MAHCPAAALPPATSGAQGRAASLAPRAGGAAARAASAHQSLARTGQTWYVLGGGRPLRFKGGTGEGCSSCAESSPRSAAWRAEGASRSPVMSVSSPSASADKTLRSSSSVPTRRLWAGAATPEEAAKPVGDLPREVRTWAETNGGRMKGWTRPSHPCSDGGRPQRFSRGTAHEAAVSATRTSAALCARGVAGQEDPEHAEVPDQVEAGPGGRGAEGGGGGASSGGRMPMPK